MTYDTIQIWQQQTLKGIKIKSHEICNDKMLHLKKSVRNDAIQAELTYSMQDAIHEGAIK